MRFIRFSPAIRIYRIHSSSVDTRHLCYDTANSTILKSQIDSAGALSYQEQEQLLIPSDCSKPSDGDIMITSECLGQSTGLMRVHGNFFHNATGAYNLFLPHKLDHSHKLNKVTDCTVKDADESGNYDDNCRAKWVWMDRNYELTNPEIFDAIIKKIDDGILAAYFQPVAGMKVLFQVFLVTGIITIVSGLICREPEEEDDEEKLLEGQGDEYIDRE